MRKFTLCLMALAGSLALTLVVAGQQEQAGPGRMKTPEFQEHVAVNYILLDVIVTDRAGNYIRNLTRDDFEIRENGKPVQIESLDEYQMMDFDLLEAQEPGAVTAQLQQPPRNIIILFDLLYSSSYGIKRAVEMVEKFVLERIQPGDRVMVASYYNSLKTIQPFTSDKERVIKALRETGFTTEKGIARLEAPGGAAPQSEPGLGSELLNEEELGERALQAQSETVFAIHNARNYMISMQALANVVKHYPGRKTMILLSEGMSYDLIDPTEPNAKAFGAFNESRQQGQNPMAGAARPQMSLFTDWEKMLEIMNDAKVSVYTINVGGLQPIGDASQQYAEADQISQMQDMRPALDGLKKRQDFLSSVSVETGGRAYFNTNNILKLLNSIEVDISNYYILGYRSDFDPNRSVYRRISVKLKKPGLRVLHRKGFFTPRPFSSLSRDEKDLHLTEGFLSRSQMNELEAEVSYHFVRGAPDRLNVGVCIEVPVASLEARRGKIDFEALVSNVNSEGKIFSSTHKRYLFSDAESPELRRKGLRIAESLESDKGINRIRIALRDNHTGRLSYFYYNYMFRESASDTLLLSQPFFYDPGDMRRSDAEFAAKVDRLKTWNEPPGGGHDILVHPREGSFFPLIQPEYRDGDTVSFFVTLYNLKRDAVNQSELQFDLAVSPVPEEEGGQREYYRVAISDPGINRLRSGGGIAFEADFPMGSLKPGLYDLFVVVTDTTTGRKAASASRFRVVE